MQLYALCESIEKYFTGLGAIHVICRSDQNFKDGYKIVESKFSNFAFHYQGKNPQLDFKSILFDSLKKCDSNYTMFAVDDIIVKDYVDLSKCADAIEKYNAYAFFLRLGKNINYCFMQKRHSLVPICKEEESGLFSYISKNQIAWGASPKISL